MNQLAIEAGELDSLDGGIEFAIDVIARRPGHRVPSIGMPDQVPQGPGDAVDVALLARNPGRPCSIVVGISQCRVLTTGKRGSPAAGAAPFLLTALRHSDNGKFCREGRSSGRRCSDFLRTDKPDDYGAVPWDGSF
jgi:hypothetical protein